MKYMRNVILYIFKRNFCDNELEYRTVLNVVFKGKVPQSFKNCPSFSEKGLEDTLFDHFLTKDGLLALRRILWVLKDTFFFLEYSPMIVQILGVLLMFLTEAEAFCCIKSMIEISRHYLNAQDEEEIREGVDLREMRWYFTFDSAQFLQFCYIFFEEVKGKHRELKIVLKHFNKVQFKYAKLFEEWAKTLYLKHLPLPTAMKVFVAYLNEGVKILFRISYGICLMLKDEILKAGEGDDLAKIIHNQTEDLNIISSYQLLRVSYTLRLTEMQKSFLELGLKNDADLKAKWQCCKVYFRPKINESSNIISYEKFESIWEWLPHQYKLNDAFLFFSTRHNGFSLSNLYNICQPHEDKAIILLIRNDKNWIFGAFCDKNLKIEKTVFRGGNSSFCFVLEPFEQRFEWAGLNSDHMRCIKDYLSFGSGGDGPAFSLDSELNNGHTYRSETYGNFPFNGSLEDSRFQCLDLELFILSDSYSLIHNKK